MPGPFRPQVKICGLTDVEQARLCARLGAAAAGCVFYPKSPRHVSEETARAISGALPAATRAVGVFVDASLDTIRKTVERCRLGGVQLHGREAPELIEHLTREGILVIKALFFGGHPSPETAADYPADAYLVECAGGVLPGGNALEWNWKDAAGFGLRHPLILAGGLTPDNIREAVAAAQPDAVDVSSGVESRPGCKDLEKVKAFLEAVADCSIQRQPRMIY